MTQNQEVKKSSRTWKRFKRNPLAMGGLFFIFLMVAVVVAGPFIRPDATENANQQQLAISRMKPGFHVFSIRINKAVFHQDGLFTMWLHGGRDLAFEEWPISEVVSETDRTVTVKLFSSGGEGKIKVLDKHSLILSRTGSYLFEKKFLLGTDKYGRDLLSRLMAGTFISLSVGAIAVFISVIIGLVLGIIAGYYRGWIDSFIMWFTNVVWSIPTLLLVMAIIFAFGTGFWKVFVAVGLTMWVEVARIARGQVLGIREKEYIEAAKALGYSQFRILFRHVLPNILSPVIVICAANFASAILIEAGLSFLGLGAQIPAPSWGNMIREHYALITTELAYLAILPGLLIMLLVLSFMMVGNGLRDALDVRG